MSWQEAGFTREQIRGSETSQPLSPRHGWDSLSQGAVLQRWGTRSLSALWWVPRETCQKLLAAGSSISKLGRGHPGSSLEHGGEADRRVDPWPGGRTRGPAAEAQREGTFTANGREGVSAEVRDSGFHRRPKPDGVGDVGARRTGLQRSSRVPCCICFASSSRLMFHTKLGGGVAWGDTPGVPTSRL